VRAAACAAVWVCLVAAPAAGQGRPRAEALAALAPPEAAVPLSGRTWVRPLASLVVPGSGQLLAGQPRGLVYLAAEVWFLARAVALRQDSRRESTFFRTLAYTVARRRYGYDRVDGAWPYYEEMGQYIESGAFNAGSPAAFTPEGDTATYNGHIWQVARRTYFEDPDSTPPLSSPEYVAALRFYQGRAVGDVFRWSWRDARLEQDVYRASIRASDEAYRSATNFLGAVLLNHLVSAVDAFIATRLGRNGVLPVVRPAEGGLGAVLEWRAAF
jgi:hypothetical protein